MTICSSSSVIPNLFRNLFPYSRSFPQILKRVQDDNLFSFFCHSEFSSESFFLLASLPQILKPVQDDNLFSFFCHSEFISESFVFTSRPLQQILKQVQDDGLRVKFFPSWLTLLFYGRGKRHENFPHQWSGRMKIFKCLPDRWVGFLRPTQYSDLLSETFLCLLFMYPVADCKCLCHHCFFIVPPVSKPCV